MAERPDLEYWVPRLREEVVGKTIIAARVLKPVILRSAVPEGTPSALAGREVDSVTRHGNFVVFVLGDIQMTISPMLAGRFEVCAPSAKPLKDLALTLALSDGRELRYRDAVQMGKVYLTPADDPSAIVGYSRVGIDILDRRTFTRAAFRGLAKGRRDQVRVFLMDKSALDCLGNAYADEVLFAAGVHPKTWVRELSAEGLDRLHDAIVSVVDTASRTIAERKPPLPEKLRDFLVVRNRHKQPCSRCGTTIRKVGVRGYDSFFCPTCQPATRKTSVVNWSKT